MDVYEIKLKVYLRQDLTYENASTHIASFIDRALTKEPHLAKFHEKNQFKNYVFCSLYPIAKGGIYLKNKDYSIMIRTTEADLAGFFSTKLSNYQDNIFIGKECQTKVVPKKLIQQVYTLTPIVLKTERYWKNNISFEQFEKLITVNLIKKYNAIHNTKIDENFQLYHSIEVINKKPIKVPYKNISFLGDKIELQVAENTQAQALMYMALGTGVGTNNARGSGFLSYKYM